MDKPVKKTAEFKPPFFSILNPDEPGSAQSFYEYAIEVAADEVFLMDETSRILYVNQSACHRLGYTREELIGKYVWEWDPQFKKDIWPSWWASFLEQKHVKFETQHCTKDGEVFPVEIKAHLYEHEDKIYSLAFVNDLTEKKQIQENIESKSRELIQVSSRAKHYQDALLELSAQKITSLNDTFQKICETSSLVLDIARVSIWLIDDQRKSITCKNIYDVKTGHSQGGVLNRRDFPGYFSALDKGLLLSIADAARHEATREFAEPYLKPNGIASMLDVPLFYDTEVIGVVCHEHVGEIRQWNSYETDFASTIASFVSLAIEVNKRKDIEKNLESMVNLRTREAVDANEAKSQFLANMSHELRTPMHSILSFTNLALKRTEDEKVSKYLNNIKTSATRLTDLLNDLLDLAKLESGKAELNLEKISLDELLKQSLNEVEGLLHEKGIKTDLELRLDEEIEIDSKLMMQVLINLLSNAIKFSPENSTLHIKACKAEDNSDSFVFSVIDSGNGIPKDQLHLIFDKFVQSSINKAEKKGTGLGLPISKEIVELHGGQIWAESPPMGRKSGAALNFKLPLRQSGAGNGLKKNRIHWNASYSVGVTVLDNQHKKIIDLINQLCDVPENLNDDNRQFYQDLVSDLYLYINEHLIYEESFLREKNYPELELHTGLHNNFRITIDKFADDINNNVQGVYLKIFMFLRHWFDHHILQEDMKYREYFENRKKLQ